MIPKKALEKAIEGGWKPKFGEINWVTYGNGENTVRLSNDSIALDPTFWQTLGKVLGWSETRQEFPDQWRFTWLHHAHRFYDLILEGKGDNEVSRFWAELLK